ncbi:ABC transporter ATP-binding protein [Maliponia aquimaris]|uniref:High-affinity branched-chain amino acid transport ATP-binding protein LivF n=1 Tax=Maliponia aquimaris TaxID=1673631 RepID=A0A238K2Z2_9RHOB|nr:ABC transporter ATP-binding protein [Maliponia aquimaris]SMX36827.1 High-affinity branched-chain amino acid transport ATP-binding protein LivF [Maliponia aquimaris]
MSEPLLRVEGLTAGYVPDLPILRGVSVAAEEAKITLVIGPNGAGKSTLIKAVAGLIPVSAGRVTLAGQEITGSRPDLMARHGMAYVPQTANIFRSLTIRQNLELAARRVPGSGIDPLLTRFPMLGEKLKARAGTLSGGQRQVLAVAMALAANPSLILMDEPSAGLSPIATQEVLGLARELTAEGVTILLVEQNVKAALKIADHCYILAEGRNQLDGPAADLLGDPRVAEIYLGGRRREAS